MRRHFRRARAAIDATLVAIPSHIAVEVAVVAAFAVILLAIATPGDHRNLGASAAHPPPERLKTGVKARPPACAPDVQGRRCLDLQSYV